MFASASAYRDIIRIQVACFLTRLPRAACQSALSLRLHWWSPTKLRQTSWTSLLLTCRHWPPNSNTASSDIAKYHQPHPQRETQNQRLSLLPGPRLCRALLLDEQLSAVHPSNSAALGPPEPHHVVGIAYRRRACAVARYISGAHAVSRYAYFLIKHATHLYG